MAQISNTFETFDAKGLREGLSDVIYRISPEETPFMSNVGKGSVSTTYYEWQNDALASPDLANNQREGEDYTAFPAVVPTTRLGNHVQISTKQVIVSGTNEQADKAGRKSELAYQLALRSAELKRDIEAIASQAQVASPGSGNGATNRKTASMEAFLRTNSNRATTGTAGTNPTLSSSPDGYPSALGVDGTTRAYTETILKDVAQKVWTSGGNLTLMLVGGAQKQTVSTFAGIAQQRRETGNSPVHIIGAADVYVSDFGNVQIVPSRFSRNRSALFLDPQHIEIVFYRSFRTIVLAKTGDAEKRLLLVEWGLKVNHEAAHGIAADLT